MLETVVLILALFGLIMCGVAVYSVLLDSKTKLMQHDIQYDHIDTNLLSSEELNELDKWFNGEYDD